MGNPKAFGNLFEYIFLQSCLHTQGMAITRFPDGCKVVGKTVVVRIKTPWDWILTYGGVSAFIDTKTTEENTFPFSKICEHQVTEMIRHSERGAKSGYVIWFRKSDFIMYIPANNLYYFLNKRGSIKLKQEGSTHLGKSTNFDSKMIFGIN